MKIGELAQRSGLPASTIRFYEQKGLIPNASRASNGYRVYDVESMKRLQLIKFAQSLGFALEELPLLVDEQGGWDHDKIMHRLQQKHQEAESLLQQLSIKKQRISQLIHQLGKTWQSGQCMQQDKLAEILTGNEF